MSDQEKKGAANALGSSVVMVDQTTDNRRKQPYRPTELQDENEMYQKRSRAPVVPSVAEELKHLNEDSSNANAENRERKECERAMSSEKHKHSVAKKFSSNTKRRDSSPENIALTATELDKKRNIPPTQPIPPDVDTALSGVSDPVEKVATSKPDEDSITEEIAELRTPELEKKHSDWETHLPKVKKEISWDDKEYQENVILNEMIARSEVWMLDRKASVGPCYRPGMPFEGPSGITICLPKKSLKAINQPSGISINIPKKSTVSKSKMALDETNKIDKELDSKVDDQALKIGQRLHNIATEKQESRWFLEIQHFASLMSFQKIELTVYEYFPLDGTLMYNMLTSAAMYLIILVQFDNRA